MDEIYTDPDLRDGLLMYLRGRDKGKFQNYDGLPETMRGIAMAQGKIG